MNRTCFQVASYEEDIPRNAVRSIEARAATDDGNEWGNLSVLFLLLPTLFLVIDIYLPCRLCVFKYKGRLTRIFCQSYLTNILLALL